MGLFNWGKTSPFEPFGAHMERVQACVQLVRPMFECVRAGNYDELKSIAERVFKAEHEADVIKNEIRKTVPTTFSLPVFRGDLLAYLHVQDDIADSVEDIAVMLTIKNLVLPDALADEVLGYVAQVLEVCEILSKAGAQLEELAEEDFGGRRAQEVLKFIGQADHAEWVADKLQYKLAQKLFALEDEIRATDIFLWSNIFQELGKLANHADKTGERLRRMLSR